MANDTVKKPDAEVSPTDKAALINLAFDDRTDHGLEPPTPFDIPHPDNTVSPEKSTEAADKDKTVLEPVKNGVPQKATPTEKSADANDAIRKEQETLLKALEEKADAFKPAKSTKKPPAKQIAAKDKPFTGPKSDIPKREKQTRSPRMPGETKKAGPVSEAPSAPSTPEPLRDAPRSGQTEQIVFINHAELFLFKNHPFQVRDDEAMKSLVESVKEPRRGPTRHRAPP